MQNKNRAFTLIELLVVVLIIGILAAVAVPQYKFAVAKSRVAQLITLAQTIITAEKSYYLANGTYTRDWTTLDVGFSGTRGSNGYFFGNGWGAELSAGGQWVALWDDHISGLRLYFGFNGNKDCHAVKENEQANQLCQHFTRKSSGASDGAWYSYEF